MHAIVSPTVPTVTATRTEFGPRMLITRVLTDGRVDTPGETLSPIPLLSREGNFGTSLTGEKPRSNFSAARIFRASLCNCAQQRLWPPWKLKAARCQNKQYNKRHWTSLRIQFQLVTGSLPEQND